MFGRSDEVLGLVAKVLAGVLWAYRDRSERGLPEMFSFEGLVGDEAGKVAAECHHPREVLKELACVALSSSPRCPQSGGDMYTAVGAYSHGLAEGAVCSWIRETIGGIEAARYVLDRAENQ